MLAKRIISAIIFALFFIAALLNKWLFLLVFMFFLGVQTHELLNIAGIKGYSPFNLLTVLANQLFFITFFLIAQGILNIEFLLLPLLFVFVLFFLELWNPHNTTLENLATISLAVVYIGIPFSSLNFIVFEKDYFHYERFIAFFSIVWAMDIFAFFVGKYFGKHKIWEKISPNKTIEGTIGGWIMAFLISYLFYKFTHWFSLKDAIVWATIISIAGFLGDLVESKIKRSASLKDSGNIMPGHGGLLDRFDSTLLSAPFIAAYLMLF